MLRLVASAARNANTLRDLSLTCDPRETSVQHSTSGGRARDPEVSPGTRRCGTGPSHASFFVTYGMNRLVGALLPKKGSFIIRAALFKIIGDTATRCVDSLLA